MGMRARVMTGTAIAMALALGGCSTPVHAPNPSTAMPTASAPAASSPSPSLAPSPAPEPEPAVAVDALIARPQALELRAGGEVVATLPYMSNPEEAVAQLTEVFGEAPVDEPYDGGNHRPDGVYHHWDPFVLDERFYPEDRRERDGLDWIVWPRFAVYFDGPAVGGVTLSTESGWQTGDAWADVASDPAFDGDIWTCIGNSVEAETIEVPEGRGSDRVNVVVVPSEDGQSVRWIGAPEMETEGCA